MDWGMSRSMRGQGDKFPHQEEQHPGRNGPLGPEGRRPHATLMATLGGVLSQHEGNEALCPWTGGRAGGSGAEVGVTTSFIGRLLCFSWQILITLYFDHTVECYVSRSKLNLKLTREEDKCKIHNTLSISCSTKSLHPLRKERSRSERALMPKSKAV